MDWRGRDASCFRFRRKELFPRQQSGRHGGPTPDGGEGRFPGSGTGRPRSSPLDRAVRGPDTGSPAEWRDFLPPQSQC